MSGLQQGMPLPSDTGVDFQFALCTNAGFGFKQQDCKTLSCHKIAVTTSIYNEAKKGLPGCHTSKHPNNKP